MTATVSHALLQRHLQKKRPLDRLCRENEARRGEHRSMGAFHKHAVVVACVVLVAVALLCRVVLMALGA